MRILIATGSFKDVYTPIEGCALAKKIVSEVLRDRPHEIMTLPIADGGESTTEVLASFGKLERHWVRNVTDPRGSEIDTYYVGISANTAFIGSASILGMSPALEEFKDPRILTSFGLGQLILDAASRGYRQVMLGLGGTSTVDGGLGMAQALGVTMLDGSGGKIVPLGTRFFAGGDLPRVSFLDFSDVDNELKRIKFEVLADANLTLKEMTTSTPQKIGTPFSANQAEILDQLYRGIFHYGEVVEVISGDTGLQDKHFFGAAGGILLSVAALFEYEVKLGTDFLFDFLGIEEQIVTSDLVITGEGKFDNSLHGKGPIGVSRIARKHGIPVLYLCGTVDSTLKDCFEEYLTERVPDYLRNQGIHGMVSGHNLYDNVPGWDNWSNLDRVNAYQHHTPLIWRQALKQYFQRDSADDHDSAC